jgi:VWFA-related protein
LNVYIDEASIHREILYGRVSRKHQALNKGNTMRQDMRIHFIMAVLTGVLSVSLLFGQSKEDPSQQKVPQHDAAAVIKLVAVRVLDQDGRPVTDLKKEDFILYDNGEKKIITEFEVHTLSEAGMEVRSSGQASELSDTVKGMNRRLFLFLDIQGSDVNGMANAKKAALHFVDTQLRPGDEVGILGFSPMSGFFIQEYLTTDHKKIRKAIVKTKDIEVKPGAGSSSGGELNDRRQVKEVDSGSEGSRERENRRREDSGESRSVFGYGSLTIGVPGTSRSHRRDFTPRMIDLAQAFKYIPGNKSIILFTARNLSSRIGKEFAGASTPMYTVNTRNWIMKGVKGMTLSVKEKYIWTDHPLKDLAQASGGKYFADIEDVETISRDVQMLTGNFYVLGYYVNESWDGAYHQIKVEARRPGLQVLAQHGYFNPKPFAELSDFEKQLHLWDLMFADKPVTLDPLDIPVEPLFISGRENMNCALLARITVNEKTGIPPSKVEIFAFIFNEDNKALVTKTVEMDLAPFDQKFLFSYFTANLPSGEYECRIVARDLETGQAVVGKTVFALPEKSDSEIVLSSPLLFAKGPESQIVRFSEGMSREEKDKALSLSELYKFLPRNHCLVVRDIESGIKSLLAVLPLTVAEGPAPEIELSVRLHPRPEGEAINLTAEIIDIKNTSTKTDILMIEIRLPDLKPGEYELEIEALEKEILASSFVRKFLVKKY